MMAGECRSLVDKCKTEVRTFSWHGVKSVCQRVCVCACVLQIVCFALLFVKIGKRQNIGSKSNNIFLRAYNCC